MEEKELFNDLIESYSKLPTNEKRKELGKEISETTLVIKKLLSDLLPDGYSMSHDIDDFNNLFQSTTSEDEYLTGLYEDYLDFKELLGLYLEKVTDMYYETEDNNGM